MGQEKQNKTKNIAIKDILGTTREIRTLLDTINIIFLGCDKSLKYVILRRYML